MNHDRNAFKAGLFILISAALIVGVILTVSGRTESMRTHKVAFALSDDIGGLRVGDEVRMGGWRVGTVDAIEAVGFDQGKPRIEVAFSFPQKYPLREKARIGVQQSLTGAATLNIDHLGEGRELAESDIVPGRPDPKSALLSSLGEAGPNLSAMVSDARLAVADVRQQTVPKANAALDSFKGTGDTTTALVSDVKGRVPAAVEKYNGVADKTGTMMQSITDMIGPSTTDWKGLIANLNQTSGSLNQSLPPMLAKLDKTLAGATTAMEEIQKTLGNAKEATGTLKNVLGRNESKLDGMIASLKTTGDNLKAASSEIRRSPWRLLYKPAANEVANLNVYDSARQFAEGANDLNEAAAALRDALKTGGASQADIKQLSERLDKSFNKFHEVEGKLWSEVKQ